MSTLPSKLTGNLTSSQPSAAMEKVSIISWVDGCNKASNWCSCFCFSHLKSILKVATRVMVLKCKLDGTPLIEILQQFTISLRVKTNIPTVTFKTLPDLALFPLWPHLLTTVVLTLAPPATLVSLLFFDHTRHCPTLRPLNLLFLLLGTLLSQISTWLTSLAPSQWGHPIPELQIPLPPPSYTCDVYDAWSSYLPLLDLT